MPYGYKFQIGIQRVTEPNPDPDARRGRWAGVLIAALALAAIVAWAVRPAGPAAAAPAAPAAHIAAAPTATARPAPAPSVVRVTGQTGAVCFLPGGKTINPVTLAVVP